MEQPVNPTAHRRQLGAELRRLREAAGLHTSDAAEALECSASRVSRIETARGTAKAKPDDVRKLCDLYGVKDETKVAALLDMVTSSQRRGWWQMYDGVLPSGLENLVGLESTARAVRAWEPLLVHGLLQTPEYARAVFASARTHRPGDIDDLVHVRAKRQESLTRSQQPLELWAILDEAVLRRPLGGASVMRAQLEHLASLAELPNVTIQVVPMATTSHPGLGGPFSLLEFESEPTVVYVESPAGNLYLEKVRDVRSFAGTFDLLRAEADGTDASTALIRSVAKER